MIMKDELKTLVTNNIGKVVGVGIGLVFGILYLIFGFWKTVFFMLIVGLGYFIGTRIDNNDGVRDLVDKIIPKDWR